MKKQKVISFYKEDNEPWIEAGQLKEFLGDLDDQHVPVAIATYDEINPYIIIIGGGIEHNAITIVDEKKGVDATYNKMLVLYPQIGVD